MRDLRLWLQDQLCKSLCLFSSFGKNLLHERPTHAGADHPVRLSGLQAVQTVGKSGLYPVLQTVFPDMLSGTLQGP